MTPIDCQIIMDNLDIIRHVANGGLIEHAKYDYRGKFIGWGSPQSKVLIICLANYRIYKPRIHIHVCGCCYHYVEES